MGFGLGSGGESGYSTHLVPGDEWMGGELRYSSS